MLPFKYLHFSPRFVLSRILSARTVRSVRLVGRPGGAWPEGRSAPL